MNENSLQIRTVEVTRYITPLREGGSLPAIVEADDEFMYVLKFRGAGQGIKVLIAELIVGEIARALGLKVPELVFAGLAPDFGRTEPDEEIQDLLKASTGLNLALHYLQGSNTFDPAVNKVDARLASQIVWLDAFVMNVDRTVRNTNMLMWHNELWLIDHGAALYFHHSWENMEEQSKRPFVQVKDHVLLPFATELNEADKEFHAVLSSDIIQNIVHLIPDEWLAIAEPTDVSADEKRNVYFDFLTTRLSHSSIFLNEAIMPRHLYEYAVIRAVPRVEREEFANIGVIVYCASQRFLGIKFMIDQRRLESIYDAFNLYELIPRLQAFQKICEGAKEAGPIAQLPISSRFRWLTASRSTVIQTSKVHPGLCVDAAETLSKLMAELVL